MSDTADDTPDCPDCGADMEFVEPVGPGTHGEWSSRVTDLEWECPTCGRTGYTVARDTP